MAGKTSRFATGVYGIQLADGSWVHAVAQLTSGGIIVPANANGQALMAASQPVVIASDQTAVQVSPRNGTATVEPYSSTTTGIFDSAGSGRAVASALYARISGNLLNQVRTPDTFKTVALTAATAETTAWTPAAGKKFRLMGGWLTASAQTVLTFKDNTAGTTILIVELGANVPFNLAGMGNGILSAVANNVLTVTRATSAILNGTLLGTEE